MYWKKNIIGKGSYITKSKQYYKSIQFAEQNCLLVTILPYKVTFSKLITHILETKRDIKQKITVKNEAIGRT